MLRLAKSGLSCFKQIKSIRQSSTKISVKEISIPVPWGEIRGKWWGPRGIRPIVALHGWQDNCGSFDRLIPLLINNSTSFLAIDFPGHGFSSRLPIGMYYHFTNYLLTVKYIQKYLQWTKLPFMGHSMGAATIYTYTMLYPQNVDFLICLDGVKPLTLKNPLEAMANNIESFLNNNVYALETQEPPAYTLEEIKEKLHKANNGSVLPEYAWHILERNIAPLNDGSGKYYFTKDPRLRSRELFVFSQEQLLENARKIACPIFIAKCKEASYFEPKEYFYQALNIWKRNSRDCEFHYVDGTHHAHLNNPEPIAELVNKFILKHNVDMENAENAKQSVEKKTQTLY